MKILPQASIKADAKILAACAITLFHPKEGLILWVEKKFSALKVHLAQNAPLKLKKSLEIVIF